MENRSVPANVVLPHIAYRDVPAAVDWLEEKFGFRELYRYGDPAARMGAMLSLGEAWVMVATVKEGEKTPRELGFGTQMLTVFVEDVGTHFAKAKAAGVEIFEELHETVYGELQFGAVDLEGHRWLFSRHARDVAPGEWGATVA